MDKIFLNLLNRGIAAGWLILAVLILSSGVEKGSQMDPMHPLGNCGCPSDLSFFPGKCIQPDSQWRDIKPHNGHVCPEAGDNQRRFCP